MRETSESRAVLNKLAAYPEVISMSRLATIMLVISVACYPSSLNGSAWSEGMYDALVAERCTDELP